MARCASFCSWTRLRGKHMFLPELWPIQPPWRALQIEQISCKSYSPCDVHMYCTPSNTWLLGKFGPHETLPPSPNGISVVTAVYCICRAYSVERVKTKELTGNRHGAGGPLRWRSVSLVYSINPTAAGHNLAETPKQR